MRAGIGDLALVHQMARILSVALSLMVSASVAAAEPKEPARKLDPETSRLRGYWMLASTEKEEKTTPGDMGLEEWWYWSDWNEFYSIEADGRPVLEIRVRGSGPRYRLYPKNRPSALQAEGSARPGFYKLEGDTLTICDPGPKARWAREFKTRVGDKRTEIRIFKRLPDYIRLTRRVPYEREPRTGKGKIGLWFTDGSKQANLKSLHDAGEVLGVDDSEAFRDVIIKARGPVRRLVVFEKQVTDDNAPDLAGISGLEELGLSHLRLSDDALRHVAKISSLRSLTIHETPVGDKAIEHLKSLTDLTALSLTRTKITGRGIKSLAELRKLTSLRTDAMVTDHEIPVIAKFVELKELRLEDTRICDDSLNLLRLRLPALEVLDLNSDAITDQAVLKLAEHPKLREVTIVGRKVSQMAVEQKLGQELAKRGGKAVWIHPADARAYFEAPFKYRL
jgi:hypothetical protein